MIFGQYYCCNCKKYFFVEPPAERCNCGSIEIKKIRELYETQVDKEIKMLESKGEKIL